MGRAYRTHVAELPSPNGLVLPRTGVSSCARGALDPPSRRLFHDLAGDEATIKTNMVWVRRCDLGYEPGAPLFPTKEPVEEHAEESDSASKGNSCKIGHVGSVLGGQRSGPLGAESSVGTAGRDR